ncbi:hypothetical protein ARHIZOSPH14_04230 [Agromyces rhizosphaerae]|uniref:Type II secretion system protein GspF domain-containing protein n=1 Tax=Agromyces rhizosphaerae TaxID=88374 RepID=A0A9W6CU99_9MICO|nr:type II secretion system F family protein [Agromyces rhizosphaerae]GLI26181.1 hypothetical protein ARHIZOSPH14_04230 [Agromyces rhizosphaerae]
MIALRRRGPAPGTEVDAVATGAHRLAVLLAAGVAPAAAWAHLASTAGGVAEHAADAARTGGDVAGAVVGAAGALPAPARLGWQALAAGWSVAERSGSPLAQMLRDTAGALRDVAELQRELDAVLAGPRATARLVALLPPVGLAFGAALGFDTVGALLGSPLGLGSAVAGVALLGAGLVWSRALVARAARPEPAPGLALDLLAVALAGGASVPRARAAVVEALDACLPAARADAAADEVVALSRRAGVPVGELLRAEASSQRLAARAAGRAGSAALAVRLMLPLAACTLPAFVLLGVLPMLVSVVATTVADLA